MIRIAFEDFTNFKKASEGPKISLQRLCDELRKFGEFKIVSRFNPFYHFSIHNLTIKPHYKHSFKILRVDGIYFDLLNTQGETNTLNRPLFKSIDEADAIIFISEFSKKLVEVFHCKIEKPHVILHNSVDLDIFSNSGDNKRNYLGISQDDFVLITSAKWRRIKRLKEIVTLFQQLKTKTKYKLKLIVLGDSPDHVVSDKDIFYIGHVPPSELPSWYRTGDLYVHLCTIEACGNTQIEAIACGLPVLCTNNGGIRETVEKATAGIVSNVDLPYSFEMIDHYNPPPLDANQLYHDALYLIENIENYKKSINRDAVSIYHNANTLLLFIKKINNNLNNQKVSLVEIIYSYLFFLFNNLIVFFNKAVSFLKN